MTLHKVISSVGLAEDESVPGGSSDVPRPPCGSSRPGERRCTGGSLLSDPTRRPPDGLGRSSSRRAMACIISAAATISNRLASASSSSLVPFVTRSSIAVDAFM